MISDQCQLSNIIQYTIDDIDTISKGFDATLDADIIQKLLEIKKINKFVSMRSPLRITYKVHSSQLKQQPTIDNVNDITFYENSIRSHLNKLTPKNYDTIIIDIKSTIDLVLKNDTINQKFINLFSVIFEKAMTEKIYSELYSKLCYELHNYYKEIDINTMLKSLCDDFYKNNISNSIAILSSATQYDQLCDIFSKKSQFLGGFLFITNLFKHHSLSYTEVKQYYIGLKEYLIKSPPEYVEKYIDTIISILENAGKELNEASYDSFKIDFMDFIYTIKDNKELVKNKYRFKLLDIIDLFENGWVQNKEEEWTSVQVNSKRKK